MKVRDGLVAALVAVVLAGGVAACNDSDADEPTDGETSSTSPSPDEVSRDEAVTAAKDAVRTATEIAIDADRSGRPPTRVEFAEAYGEPLLSQDLANHRQLAENGIIARGRYRIVSMATTGVAPSIGEVRLRICVDFRQLRYVFEKTGENALEDAPNPGFYISTQVVRRHDDSWTVDESLDEVRGAKSCDG